MLSRIQQRISFEEIPTEVSTCFVFLGVSSKSRSNAIIVSSQWTHLVIHYDWCAYGGLIAFQVADKCLIVDCLHVPYHGHQHDLTTAIGVIGDMHSCVYD